MFANQVVDIVEKHEKCYSVRLCALIIKNKKQLHICKEAVKKIGKNTTTKRFEVKINKNRF